MELENERSKRKIIKSGDIEEQDSMLMTVGSLMELVTRIQKKEMCSTCNKSRTRLILERKSGQYKLNFVCTTCFSKTTWVNSTDWNHAGVIRKFADFMTLSGVNYWQYRRYYYYLMYSNECFVLLILTYHIFIYQNMSDNESTLFQRWSMEDLLSKTISCCYRFKWRIHGGT